MRYAPKRNDFLQYHRSRDYSPVDFVLEGMPKKGQLEMPFVRGATPKEGIECKVLVYPSQNRDYSILSEDFDGSYDIGTDFIFSEAMTRTRKLQMITTEKLDHILQMTACNHSSISTRSSLASLNEVGCSFWAFTEETSVDHSISITSFGSDLSPRTVVVPAIDSETISVKMLSLCACIN